MHKVILVILSLLILMPSLCMMDECSLESSHSISISHDATEGSTPDSSCHEICQNCELAASLFLAKAQAPFVGQALTAMMSPIYAYHSYIPPIFAPPLRPPLS